LLSFFRFSIPHKLVLPFRSVVLNRVGLFVGRARILRRKADAPYFRETYFIGFRPVLILWSLILLSPLFTRTLSLASPQSKGEGTLQRGTSLDSALAPRRLREGREATLEKLSQNYLQSPHANSKKALITFCQNNKKSQLSALGYFLIGHNELRDEKLESAASFFAKAASKPTPIDDYLYYYWGESFFKLHEFASAQKKLAYFLDKFSDSPLKGKALSLYWETSLSLNDPQAILNSIKSTTEATENPEPLFYVAQARESLGQLDEALRTYQRLYYFFPLYSKNSIVSLRIPLLLESNPELKFDIPKEWKITRIEKLFSGKRYHEALKDLELLFQTDSSFTTMPQFQLWLGISQFGSGKYTDALQTLKEVDSPDPAMNAQAWFYAAECYRKLDDYPVFKQSVETLEQKFPKSVWLEKALFSIGNYNLVNRHLEESTSFYQRAVDLFPSGVHVTDCHWRVSWQYYRLKNYQRAFELFVDHLNRFPDSEHRAAALYWAARCKGNLGQPADALRIYQAVHRRFSTDYYGLLAEKQISSLKSGIKISQELDPQVERISQDLENSTSQANKIDLFQLQDMSWETGPRVKAFTLIQLFELAAKELSRSQVYGDSRAIYFQVAQLFYREKNFMQAIVNLRRVFPNHLEMSFHSLSKTVWEMFYPANFTSIIFRESARHDVDPYLLLALIRQESAFNPQALSRANAHGLMQLLPSTARIVAKSMKLRSPTVARLNDPAVNIRLGTKYFADLLRKFQGQEDKALASYNAGEDRVGSWISEGGFVDSAEFVETIPFSETRNYIKTIYRNYWFYKTLYGQGKGT
jgi:soluble lytic murein transglycosylase